MIKYTKEQIGTRIEVDSLDDIPPVEEGLRFFACIGGSKNYECFLDYKSLSRAQVMEKYKDRLDKCHTPIYEDDEIIVRQDAQIPIPGFYIVATKEAYRKVIEMDSKTYQKCLSMQADIREELATSLGIENTFMYYDEHYKKKSSTHFWVMPIYREIIEELGLDPTILKRDIWNYQDFFKFSDTRESIYEFNDVMREKIKVKLKGKQ